MPAKILTDDLLDDLLDTLEDDLIIKLAKLARSLGVNDSTLRSALHCRKKNVAEGKTGHKSHGGQNKILTEVQEEAICEFIPEMYHRGWSATQTMIQGIITSLC